MCRTEFGTDFALTNGGNLRANHVFEEGHLKWKFMTQILPMTDKVLMIELPGKIIRDLMENGVSLWPSLDGRWPIVSGFKFSFDPSKPPGSRVVSLQKTNGDEILPNQIYSMAVKHFLLGGKDGYTSILDPSVKIITDVEEAPTIQEIVKSWFINFGKTQPEIEGLPMKARKIFEERLTCMGSDVNSRCPQGKFIKIAPKIEGRIINIG